MANTMFTCAIRKISTGHRLAAFSGDSLDALRDIATTLMQSPNYCRCYVVCTDYQGNVCFSLQPQGQVARGPGAGMPMPAPPAQRLPAPSWDGYYEGQRAQAVQAALPPYRQPQQVVDAEFEEELRSLPLLRQ